MRLWDPVQGCPFVFSELCCQMEAVSKDVVSPVCGPLLLFFFLLLMVKSDGEVRPSVRNYEKCPLQLLCLHFMFYFLIFEVCFFIPFLLNSACPLFGPTGPTVNIQQTFMWSASSNYQSGPQRTAQETSPDSVWPESCTLMETHAGLYNQLYDSDKDAKTRKKSGSSHMKKALN